MKIKKFSLITDEIFSISYVDESYFLCVDKMLRNLHAIDKINNNSVKFHFCIVQMA